MQHVENTPVTDNVWKQICVWNATEQDYPRDASVHQLVERYAVAHPEATAIVSGGQRLSYGELNSRANQLAHYLLAQGVAPDVPVGICLERSPEFIVALLGILKAGGAYVPLDPSYPAERLAFMVEDARLPVLITRKALLDRLPQRTTQTLCLDSEQEVLQRQPEHTPVSSSLLSHLVYIIYTSGSTGRPKGVQITHESLLNLIFWHQRTFAVTPADRATQVTSPAFDATGWEVWPYLTAGASLYLPDEETRVTAPLLRDWLLEQEISISFLPTALAEQLITLDWPTTTKLRYILTGADTLHRYPPASLPFTLVNNYGPTEATVVATSGPVPPEGAEGLPSIGRPIANTQVYILNEQLQPVPIGEVGELYIGGTGLAKGYLNRPELTAERFIANPFSSAPQSRLYKTGDLARFLPDGQIAFLGRSDYQIKIRGYRIEPDEIMAVLNEQPAIQASVVVAREDIPGDKRLVAYLELRSDEDISVAALQEALRSRLPDYMVPSVFVQLEQLPLTPNGKLERISLPAPDESNTLRDEITTEAENPIEEQLLEIVKELLQLDEVGLDENFFMLGGHSLLGTQIIARIARTFEVDLSLRTLFSSPTVRLLAAEVEQRILEKLDAMSDEEAERLLNL